MHMLDIYYYILYIQYKFENATHRNIFSSYSKRHIFHLKCNKTTKKIVRQFLGLS